MGLFNAGRNLVDKFRNMSPSGIKDGVKKSLDWFKNKIESGFNTRINKFRNRWLFSKFETTEFTDDFVNGIKMVPYPRVGKMYFFLYDPKHKATLPYYDTFPLVLPMEYYNNGFLGMNLHYLPPNQRLILFNEMLLFKGTLNNEEYMNISYRLMKSIATTKLFQPTIHRYLYSHVRSPFAQVISSEWENAILLPTDTFKVSPQTVWRNNP